MNDKNHQAATVNEGYFAAAQLNKVPGFDPLKFLHRTGNGNQGEELRLDLRYKKLWFRLAYPKGRMKLIARHITEQMAIFEAQIYLDRSDNEPVGNFIATCTNEQAADFVKAAQDTALDYALINAGFGVQFEAPQPQAKVTGTPAAAPSPQQSSVANSCQPEGGKEEVKAGAVPPLLKVMPNPAPVVSGEAAAETKPATVRSVAAMAEKSAAVRNETAISRESASVRSTEITAVHEENARPAEVAGALNEMARMAGAMAAGNKSVSQIAPAAVHSGSVSRKAPSVVSYGAVRTQEAAAAVSGDTLPVTVEMEFDRLPVEPASTVPGHTEESLPVGRSMETADNAYQTAQDKTVPISRFTQPAMATAQPAPTSENVAQKTILKEELPVASAQPAITAETQPPKYTADMSVEEIMQRMTFEEAQNVKVDVGTCNGWTMAQVAERRPPSLKWYVFGYKEDNNILRAAAQIMLDSISKEKAG